MMGSITLAEVEKMLLVCKPLVEFVAATCDSGATSSPVTQMSSSDPSRHGRLADLPEEDP